MEAKAPEPRTCAGRSTSSGLGAIVNNSRAIIFAHSRSEYQKFGSARWQEAVEAATRAMIDELRRDVGRQAWQRRHFVVVVPQLGP